MAEMIFKLQMKRRRFFEKLGKAGALLIWIGLRLKLPLKLFFVMRCTAGDKDDSKAV